MIQLQSILYNAPHTLTLSFNDGAKRHCDFREILTFEGLEKKLVDSLKFEKVKLSGNGRSLESPNGLDICADALRYYYQTEEKEWTELAQDSPLYQRVELTLEKKKEQ